MRPKGWRGDSVRHALAARGIESMGAKKIKSMRKSLDSIHPGTGIGEHVDLLKEDWDSIKVDYRRAVKMLDELQYKTLDQEEMDETTALQGAVDDIGEAFAEEALVLGVIYPDKKLDAILGDLEKVNWNVVRAARERINREV